MRKTLYPKERLLADKCVTGKHLYFKKRFAEKISPHCLPSSLRAKPSGEAHKQVLPVASDNVIARNEPEGRMTRQSNVCISESVFPRRIIFRREQKQAVPVPANSHPKNELSSKGVRNAGYSYFVAFPFVFICFLMCSV